MTKNQPLPDIKLEPGQLTPTASQLLDSHTPKLAKLPWRARLFIERHGPTNSAGKRYVEFSTTTGTGEAEWARRYAKEAYGACLGLGLHGLEMWVIDELRYFDARFANKVVKELNKMLAKPTVDLRDNYEVIVEGDGFFRLEMCTDDIDKAKDAILDWTKEDPSEKIAIFGKGAYAKMQADHAARVETMGCLGDVQSPEDVSLEEQDRLNERNLNEEVDSLYSLWADGKRTVLELSNIEMTVPARAKLFERIMLNSESLREAGRWIMHASPSVDATRNMPVVGVEYDFTAQPLHYNEHPSGIECQEIIRECKDPMVAFAFKHLWRTQWGSKPGQSADQDIEKAITYLQLEQARRRGDRR